MVEKFWLQEEQKEEKFYLLRSQICDLFFYLVKFVPMAQILQVSVNRIHTDERHGYY